MRSHRSYQTFCVEQCAGREARTEDQISALQCTAMHCNAMLQIADYNGEPASSWTTSAVRAGILATFLFPLSSGRIYLVPISWTKLFTALHCLHTWFSSDSLADLIQLSSYCWSDTALSFCWPDTYMSWFLTLYHYELFADMIQLLYACWADRALICLLFLYSFQLIAELRHLKDYCWPDTALNCMLIW